MNMGMLTCCLDYLQVQIAHLRLDAVVNMIQNEQLEHSPILAADIQKATKEDRSPIISSLVEGFRGSNESNTRRHLLCSNTFFNNNN